MLSDYYWLICGSSWVIWATGVLPEKNLFYRVVGKCWVEDLWWIVRPKNTTLRGGNAPGGSRFVQGEIWHRLRARWKVFWEQRRVQFCKKYIFFIILDNTTYKLSYWESKNLMPVKSFKPESKYEKNDCPLEDFTIHKLSFYPSSAPVIRVK